MNQTTEPSLNQTTEPSFIPKLEALARSLLYEGYSLYPYRNSAMKNKTPVPFGVVYPHDYSRCDDYAFSFIRAECLLRPNACRSITIELRFLQAMAGTGDNLAVERKLSWRHPVGQTEPVIVGHDPAGGREGLAAIRVTTHSSLQAVEGHKDVLKLTVRISNETPVDIPNEPSVNAGEKLSRRDVQPICLLAAHLILSAPGGEFISQQDIPAPMAGVTQSCISIGVWPVLADPGDSIMLCSPIILYDHPDLGQGSKGDLFDGTEMEEALWLHINALTEPEKKEAMDSDPRIRELMQKASRFSSEELLQLHDHLRPGGNAVQRGNQSIQDPFRKGDKLRLRLGRRRSDASDGLIDGMTATLEEVCMDYQNKVYLAVTLDNDPARDLQREMNIYRYFSPEEVERIPPAPLQPEPAPRPLPRKRIMVAGIGNMFLSDDGFGPEVIRQLRQRPGMKEVEIAETGIGGLKLAYDLMKGYDALILVDATTRGGVPGTLYLIRPDERDADGDLQSAPIDPHGSDPATVLRFLKALGAWPPQVFIVGCEPDSVAEFSIGLSDAVRCAVDEAVVQIETLIKEIYNDSYANHQPNDPGGIAGHGGAEQPERANAGTHG